MISSDHFRSLLYILICYEFIHIFDMSLLFLFNAFYSFLKFYSFIYIYIFNFLNLVELKIAEGKN